jgi:hypothetical protein
MTCDVKREGVGYVDFGRGVEDWLLISADGLRRGR